MALLRSEVDLEDRWNVEALYSSVKDWEEDFAKVKPDFSGYRGTLTDSAGVKKALEAFLQTHRKAMRLYTYAHLRNDENVADDGHRGIYQQAMMLLHQLSEEGAFLEPELLAQPMEKLEGYLRDLPDYRFFLEKIVRLKKHTLSPKEEELVAMAGRALEAPSQAFGVLNNADLDFGKVKDSTGEEHELTQGSFALFLRSQDRTLRENAFKQMHGVYKGHENTLCELLHGQVQGHLFSARSHQFESCLDAALFPKAVDTSVYHSLIQAVRSRLGAVHNYMGKRKELLGLDELHLWDVYVPLSEEEPHIEYDEAVQLVIDSVAPLGKPYQEALARGLTSDRWVDRYENENKRSGAYSSGCYDSMPYILMNYKGLLRDAMTLAHEAGHSMHSYLSRKNQPYHYADYPIFVAEVASTFNEELLFRLLMERRDDTKYLVNQKLDDIRATLFRQTMFAEFELLVHQMAERGEPMTPAVLKEKYRQLNEDYFGPHVVIDPEIAIEWSRIPHFYYNFYVYQYATGISAALTLADQVLSSGDAEPFLRFLSSGGSKFPVDLLKEAGVDVTKPDAVNGAIDIFERLLEEL